MTLIFEVMNVRLSDCKIGEELKVNKIEDGDIAPKLIEMGLTENLITKIIFIAPLGPDCIGYQWLYIVHSEIRGRTYFSKQN